jgi:hypothetical protein
LHVLTTCPYSSLPAINKKMSSSMLLYHIETKTLGGREGGGFTELTPSEASTKITTPSHKRKVEVTSSEKFT